MTARPSTMQWVCFPDPGEDEHPDWVRTAGVDGGGKIFVTAALAGREDMVYFCAREDEIKTAELNDHLYVPAGWLAQEFPCTADICHLITRAVRQHFYANSAGVVH